MTEEYRLWDQNRMHPTLASGHTLVILRSLKMFAFQGIHLKKLIYKDQTKNDVWILQLNPTEKQDYRKILP